MPNSPESDPSATARPQRIRRFAGLGLSTAVLGQIADRFTALRSHALFQADGQTFATIDDLIDCVVEDMAVGHVFMAVMDDEWRSLLFLYRPETVVIQTDSLQEDYRAAFRACAELLAAQPPTGTPLCDLVVAPAGAPAAQPVLSTITQWWRSASGAQRHGPRTPAGKR
jgi:hypothetical protein